MAMMLASLVSESVAQTPEGLQKYREGVHAYLGGRYEEARPLLEPYAEQGYALACEYVGLIYSVGLSVAPDPEEAHPWLTCAARQGAPEAQVHLALLLSTGKTFGQHFEDQSGERVAVDQATAARWLYLAAQDGDTSAMVDLAGALENGSGIRRNDRVAAFWHYEAALRGEPMGALGFARHLFHGRGTHQNFMTAYRWANFASGVFGPARTEAADLRDTIARRLSASQLVRAQEMSPLPQVTPGTAVDLPREAWLPLPGPFMGEVQKQLARLGFYEGPIDGIPGPKTAAGVRLFYQEISAPGPEPFNNRLIRRLSLAQTIGRDGDGRLPSVSMLDDPGGFGDSGATGENRGSTSAPRGVVTGTGFAVSAEGHLLTNNHVVAACSRLSATDNEGNEREANIAARDAENDIALLRLDSPPPEVSSLPLRTPSDARLGESIVVVGYPLFGGVSTRPSVTTGIVTNLVGLRDDTRGIQISAPIQQGNSGAPVLDGSGQVIAMVDSKLNALQVAQESGDIPQNVNFAIGAPLLARFLERHLPAPPPQEPHRPLSVEQIVSRALPAVYLITCYG